MRYAEWGILLVISGLGIALANFIGFDVGFMDSLPGNLSLRLPTALILQRLSHWWEPMRAFPSEIRSNLLSSRDGR